MSRSEPARKRPPKETAAPVNRFYLFSVLAVVVASVASAIAGITNGLLQDDAALLQDSTLLQDLGKWKEIFTRAYWPSPPDLYRPLESLLLSVQYAVGDGAPIVFRIVSYALYGAASVGVFRLASRCLPPTIALAVALLFAVHPVHVESIALAVAQNELLIGLLATVMVAFYLDRRRAPGGHLRWPDWGFLAGCYLAASLAKEQGLLLPALLVLAEVLLVANQSWRVRVRELWRGFAVLTLPGLVVIAVRTAILGGRVAAQYTADALAGQGVGRRALTMLQIVPEWFRLLLWPAHLRADYSPGEFVASRSFGPHEVLGLGLILLSAVVVWLARRRAPAVAFGILWAAVMLLPVSNLLVPTGILVAERTLFLPSIGMMLAVGGVAALVATQPIFSRVIVRRGLAFGVAVLVALGIWRSTSRERVWHDTPALTIASVADAPRSWVAQQAYGEMMFNLRQPADGILAFRDAISFAPETWRPRNRLADWLRIYGADKDALDQLRLSLAENPGQIETMIQIPLTLIALGRYEEARHLADSVIVAEDSPPVMVFLRHLADSAIAVKAPAGSIKIRTPPG